MIRSVKKSIVITIGNQIVSFNELQTFLFESANLVNERPIGKTPKSFEDRSYLSSNDLLFGRSSINAPQGNFDTTFKK